MRENKRPKARKLLRFRDSPAGDEGESSKQTVTTPGKESDLRTKLNKQRGKDRVGQKDSNTENEDMDESNFSPRYDDVQTSDNEEVMEVSDTFESETNSGDDIDKNNNAQRIKSVVSTKRAQSKNRKVQEIQQEITLSERQGTSETEDGELTSSENADNMDNFMEKMDDEQLAQFLKKHQQRINKVSEKQAGMGESGETDFLAQNIRKMSVRDRDGNGPVHNSQSEDTIYSRLVKQRAEFESNKAREIGPISHDNNEKQGSINNDESQMINNGTDSSFDISNVEDKSASNRSTDETDKNIVMDKFVNSPLIRETNNETFVDYISDRSPSPKRKKSGDRNDRPRKKITVQEYAKRREREIRCEEQRKEKVKQQKQREKEIEKRRDRAKDKRRRMASEDFEPFR